MACHPAPVATRLWSDTHRRYGARVYFLGIIGDASHQARKSDHNCGQSGYPASYAHALDAGVGDDRRLGNEIVELLRHDRRVKYLIFRGVGYRPWWRGGSTFSSKGHATHVHVSLAPGTTFDTRPFYGASASPGAPTGGSEVTEGEMNAIILNTAAATAKLVDERIGIIALKTAEAVNAVLQEKGVPCVDGGEGGGASASEVADELHRRLQA